MIGFFIAILTVMLLVKGVIIRQLIQENRLNKRNAEYYKAKLDEHSKPFQQLLNEEEAKDERGYHFKWRQVKKPTSMTYRLHFDMSGDGQRILEELTSRFKRNVFTDDERETCRRIGRAEVVDFIINRINTANDPRYSEQLEIAHMEQNNE
ncbi:hypothetical protein [Acinetobacter sp. Ver3]|uniref:Bbp19 family protein n=1 Tax=Acinetobacter sp. Ver3 TaxID=466088 RepID=UPI00044B5BC3|nr:hypothetical protein [Acinetobacter sp. Ver3]EZQ12083.1 hypothetical protein CL42_02005 [Acinetobacter sp. Ver3]